MSKSPAVGGLTALPCVHVPQVPVLGACCNAACRGGFHEVVICQSPSCMFAGECHKAIDARCTSCPEFSANGGRSDWRPLSPHSASFLGVPSSTTALGLRVSCCAICFAAASLKGFRVSRRSDCQCLLHLLSCSSQVCKKCTDFVASKTTTNGLRGSRRITRSVTAMLCLMDAAL